MAKKKLNQAVDQDPGFVDNLYVPPLDTAKIKAALEGKSTDELVAIILQQCESIVTYRAHLQALSSTPPVYEVREFIDDFLD